MRLIDAINKVELDNKIIYAWKPKMISCSAFKHNDECICIDPEKKSIYKTNPRYDFMHVLTFDDLVSDEWEISHTCPIEKSVVGLYNPNARWGY